MFRELICTSYLEPIHVTESLILILPLAWVARYISDYIPNGERCRTATESKYSLFPRLFHFITSILGSQNLDIR